MADPSKPEGPRALPNLQRCSIALCLVLSVGLCSCHPEPCLLWSCLCQVRWPLPGQGGRCQGEVTSVRSAALLQDCCRPPLHKLSFSVYGVSSALVKAACARCSNTSAGFYLAKVVILQFFLLPAHLKAGQVASGIGSQTIQSCMVWQCTDQGSPVTSGVQRLVASCPVKAPEAVLVSAALWCVCQLGRQPLEQHCSQLRIQHGCS